MEKEILTIEFTIDDYKIIEEIEENLIKYKLRYGYSSLERK